MRRIVLAGWCCLGLAALGLGTARNGRGGEPAGPQWPRIDQAQ
jgi:hypothetical protein